MSDAVTPLPPDQRRVLGVLVEKQKTSKSADAYPMTLNAITTGCNQKSNRDPVTDYDEDDAEETLAALQRLGLAEKVTGGRAERWRHRLYDVWRPSKVEMAVLAELLLRGPQTEGDLRGRASRMDDIADLDELRRLLAGLAERKLVVYLGEPGRRGTVVTHGFHAPDELAQARAKFANGAPDDPAPAPRPSAGPSALEARLDAAFAEIAKLREEVAALRARVGG
jgi:uncharacterized protein YceH (UPF0502 family)